MKYIIIFIASLLLSSTTAAAAELNISEAANSPVETIVFETHAEIPDDWFPLKAVSEYLPIEVSWNAKDRAIVIDSEPNRANWPSLAHEKIAVDNMGQRSRDLRIVDGITYCSPWFLANRLYGVSFVHESEVWYCNSGFDFDGRVKTAMLELQVIAPEEYVFINKYLTGGIKIANEDIEDAISYVYPYSAKPVCYIVNKKLSHVTMASTIAHEAWHVYEARSDVAIRESSAIAYEKKVMDLLLHEARMRNGIVEIYKCVD